MLLELWYYLEKINLKGLISYQCGLHLPTKPCKPHSISLVFFTCSHFPLTWSSATCLAVAVEVLFMLYLAGLSLFMSNYICYNWSPSLTYRVAYPWLTSCSSSSCLSGNCHRTECLSLKIYVNLLSVFFLLRHCGSYHCVSYSLLAAGWNWLADSGLERGKGWQTAGTHPQTPFSGKQLKTWQASAAFLQYLCSHKR